MATTDNSEWRLYDTDLTTQLAILPIGSSQFYTQKNAPGSGELKIPAGSDIASSITEKMFCELYYRGSARGGFFVENLNEVMADLGEGESQWLSLSGRGALTILEQARVWDSDGTATKRTFTATPKAAILKTLIDEAQARGALSALAYSFTATQDSAGSAWTDSEDYEIEVGKDLLAVAKLLAAIGGFEFTLDFSAGTFTLGAYKAGIGSDISSTTKFRIGENCEELSREDRGGPDLVNAMLVKYKEGFIEVTDTTSISTYGRVEGYLNIEQAQSSDSARTFSAAKLDISKDPLASKTLKVYDGVYPRLYEDYDLGDYIGLDKFGSETSDRILGIRATFDGVDFSHVTLELNTIIEDSDLQTEQALDNLLDSWNTARDANLMEVQQHLSIGLPNGNVNASFIYNNELYVFGDFTSIGNIAATRAAKYNLSTHVWYSLGSTIATEILYATVIGTTIYATTLTTVNKFAAGVWSVIGTLTSGQIRCITTDGTNLFVGGSFLSGAGLSSDKVAKWNGTTWSNSHAALYDCESLCYFGGLGNTVIYASLFTGVNTSCLQYYSAGSWHVLFSSQAKVCGGLGTDGNWVYWVLDNNHVVRYDGAGLTYDEDLGDLGFVPIAGIISGTTPTPYAARFSDVYIGRVGTASYPNGILKYSGSVFSTLGSGSITSGNVRTITVADNGDVYIGGSYGGLNDQDINYLNVFVTGFTSLADHLAGDDQNGFDLGAAIHNATAAAITDSGEIPFWDSVTAALRKITWTNIKATLKTYFDTLYQALDSDLTAIAGLSPSNDDIIQRKAGAWVNRTLTQLLADFPIAVGSYTPTITNGTNVAASTAHVCYYIRILSVAFIAGLLEVDTTAVGAFDLLMTTPVGGNFTTVDDASGNATQPGTGVPNIVSIREDPAHTTSKLRWDGYAQVSTNLFYRFIVGYSVK